MGAATPPGPPHPADKEEPIMIRLASLGILTIVALFALSNTAKSADQPPAIDTEAAEILQRMSDYLGSLERFTFRAENTIDSVTGLGQKLQSGAYADIAIERPNRFRVKRKGDAIDQEFYFDGRTLTLYGKQVNYYANMRVSKTVDINTALDLARDEVGVIVPASDLFYQDTYRELMEDVESGRVVGNSTVGGVEVHHLAFRGSEVDWQIWIAKAGAPQFTAVFSDWNTSAKLDDVLFTFSRPPEAHNIGFIPLRGGYRAGGAQ
jgi:hypothetical protein